MGAELSGQNFQEEEEEEGRECEESWSEGSGEERKREGSLLMSWLRKGWTWAHWNGLRPNLFLGGGGRNVSYKFTLRQLTLGRSRVFRIEEYFWLLLIFLIFGTFPISFNFVSFSRIRGEGRAWPPSSPINSFLCVRSEVLRPSITYTNLATRFLKFLQKRVLVRNGGLLDYLKSKMSFRVVHCTLKFTTNFFSRLCVKYTFKKLFTKLTLTFVDILF